MTTHARDNGQTITDSHIQITEPGGHEHKCPKCQTDLPEGTVAVLRRLRRRNTDETGLLSLWLHQSICIQVLWQVRESRLMPQPGGHQAATRPRKQPFQLRRPFPLPTAVTSSEIPRRGRQEARSTWPMNRRWTAMWPLPSSRTEKLDESARTRIRREAQAMVSWAITTNVVSNLRHRRFARGEPALHRHPVYGRWGCGRVDQESSRPQASPWTKPSTSPNACAVGWNLPMPKASSTGTSSPAMSG